MSAAAEKTAEQRGARGRHWTVARTLTLFMGLSLLTLGFLISLMLTLRVDSLLDAQRRLHAGSHIQAVAGELEQHLLTYLQVLRDHAAFPLMVQAVMQPETQRGIIADFMHGLGFLGDPTQQVLLDFHGRTVNARQDSPQFDYTGQPWVEALLDGVSDHHTGLSRDAAGHYWQLALPVRYNNLAEGVLVAELPVARLFKHMDMEAHTRSVRVELLHQGRTVYLQGPVDSGAVVEMPGPTPDTRLRFTIDEHMAQQARYRLRQEIAALVLVVVLLTSLLTIGLARRWFILPLLEVQACATALANNRPCNTPNRRHGLRELDDLTHGFNRMAEKIRRREHSLSESHEQLKRTHEQLQASQRRLVQSEKMASLGTMAAGVAHEINTPLGFIQGNLNTLRDYQAVLGELAADYRDLAHSRIATEPELQQHLQQRLHDEDLDFLLEDMQSLLADSLEGGHRVADIVAGLASFTRNDSPRELPVDLKQCIDEAVHLSRENIGDKIELRLQAGELPPLTGDPAQLIQLVTNLLNNAAKAIDEAGHIDVTARVQGDTVQLEVCDDGEGIAAEHMNKLFTPFFTTRAVGDGIGLGLAICHGIVQRHGGDIRVDSTPGAGSRFLVSLPIPSLAQPTEMDPAT